MKQSLLASNKTGEGNPSPFLIYHLLPLLYLLILNGCTQQKENILFNHLCWHLESVETDSTQSKLYRKLYDSVKLISRNQLPLYKVFVNRTETTFISIAVVEELKEIDVKKSERLSVKNTSKDFIQYQMNKDSLYVTHTFIQLNKTTLYLINVSTDSTAQEQSTSKKNLLAKLNCHE